LREREKIEELGKALLREREKSEKLGKKQSNLEGQFRKVKGQLKKVEGEKKDLQRVQGLEMEKMEKKSKDVTMDEVKEELERIETEVD